MAVVILRRVWTLRLRLDGFRDLECAEDPDGPLSNAGQPSHLDRMDISQVQAAAAYHRRVGDLARYLPFSRDRAIAEAVADGVGVRAIKARLRVGQGRVERVLRTIRQWLPDRNWAEPEERTT